MFKSGRIIFYSIVVVLVFIFVILVSKDDYAWVWINFEKIFVNSFNT